MSKYSPLSIVKKLDELTLRVRNMERPRRLPGLDSWSNGWISDMSTASGLTMGYGSANELYGIGLMPQSRVRCRYVIMMMKTAASNPVVKGRMYQAIKISSERNTIGSAPDRFSLNNDVTWQAVSKTATATQDLNSLATNFERVVFDLGEDILLDPFENFYNFSFYTDDASMSIGAIGDGNSIANHPFPVYRPIHIVSGDEAPKSYKTYYSTDSQIAYPFVMLLSARGLGRLTF